MEFEAEISRLYAAQNAVRPDFYLRAHSRNRALIRRQVSIFERCAAPYLANARRVLDWGCRQAVDACLARMLRGRDLELHACDIESAELVARQYGMFHDFAATQYRPLIHPSALPYDDGQFDAVIGGGVLEHVPNQSDSLRELYRVIKPGGHLIITFLPNRGSYTEALNRMLGNPHHRRRYSLGQAKRLLLEHGFVPVAGGYHQMIPSLSSTNGGVFDWRALNLAAEWLSVLNPYLERLWPLSLASTNVFIVGERVTVIP